MSQHNMSLPERVGSFQFTYLDKVSRRVLDELVRLTEKAFLTPPWSSVASNSGLLPQMVEFNGATTIIARHIDESEIAGFCIGVVLDKQSLAFFGLPAPQMQAPRPGDYHLSWRTVGRHHRGKGLGQVLTTLRFDLAREHGCKEVFGETIGKNGGTIAMHRDLGMSVYHRSQHLSESGLIERLYFRTSLCAWSNSSGDFIHTCLAGSRH